MSGLTVLSFGGGQDSTAIGYLLAEDREFRQKWAPGRCLALMSDTGDEHIETLQHVMEFGEYLQDHFIDFVHLTPDMGYHSEPWQSLEHYYRSHKAVGSKAFPKTCTDNLKIQPIYRFLEDWVAFEYGYERSLRGKKALQAFAADHGKITVLIGIAAGEEVRAKGNGNGPKWRQAAIDIQYPLIDLGWDRQACQDYIRRLGRPVPPPSNCQMCPFMSKVELLWMHRFIPDRLQDWIEIEATKLVANEHKGEKNLTVWGTRKTLPEILEEAIAEHGHMSNDELQEYKMSHGHCVMSGY